MRWRTTTTVAILGSGVGCGAPAPRAAEPARPLLAENAARPRVGEPVELRLETGGRVRGELRGVARLDEKRYGALYERRRRDWANDAPALGSSVRVTRLRAAEAEALIFRGFDTRGVVLQRPGQHKPFLLPAREVAKLVLPDGRSHDREGVRRLWLGMPHRTALRIKDAAGDHTFSTSDIASLTREADDAEGVSAPSATGLLVIGGVLLVAGGVVLVTTPEDRPGHLEGDGRNPSNFKDGLPRLAIGVILLGGGAAFAISGAVVGARSDP